MYVPLLFSSLLAGLKVRTCRWLKPGSKPLPVSTPRRVLRQEVTAARRQPHASTDLEVSQKADVGSWLAGSPTCLQIMFLLLPYSHVLGSLTLHARPSA